MPIAFNEINIPEEPLLQATEYFADVIRFIFFSNRFIYFPFADIQVDLQASFKYFLSELVRTDYAKSKLSL